MKLLIRATFLALLALGATAGVAAADDLVPTSPVDGVAAPEPAVEVAEAADDVAQPAINEVTEAAPVAREVVRQARPVAQKAVERVRPVVESGTQIAREMAQPLDEPIEPVLQVLEPAASDLPLVGSLIWPALPTDGHDPQPGADPTGDQAPSPETDPIPSGPTVSPPSLTAATGGTTGARPTENGGTTGSRPSTTILPGGAVSAMSPGSAHTPLTQTGSPTSAGIGLSSTGGLWVAVLIGALLAAASGIGWRLFESALKPPGLLPVPAVPPA